MTTALTLQIILTGIQLIAFYAQWRNGRKIAAALRRIEELSR